VEQEGGGNEKKGDEQEEKVKGVDVKKGWLRW